MNIDFDNTYVCLVEQGKNVEARVLFPGTYTPRSGGTYASDWDATMRLPDRLMLEDLKHVSQDDFAEQASLRQDFMYRELMPKI